MADMILQDLVSPCFSSCIGCSPSFTPHAPVTTSYWEFPNAPCFLTSSCLCTYCPLCLESHASFICRVNSYKSLGPKSGIFCQVFLARLNVPTSYVIISVMVQLLCKAIVCSLLSLPLNCELFEVWFTSFLHLAKGLANSQTFVEFIYSTNICWASIFVPGAVIGPGETMGNKVDQAFSEFTFYSVDWLAEGMYEWMNA